LSPCSQWITKSRQLKAKLPDAYPVRNLAEEDSSSESKDSSSESKDFDDEEDMSEEERQLQNDEPLSDAEIMHVGRRLGVSKENLKEIREAVGGEELHMSDISAAIAHMKDNYKPNVEHPIYSKYKGTNRDGRVRLTKNQHTNKWDSLARMPFPKVDTYMERIERWGMTEYFNTSKNGATLKKNGDWQKVNNIITQKVTGNPYFNPNLKKYKKKGANWRSPLTNAIDVIGNANRNAAEIIKDYSPCKYKKGVMEWNEAGEYVLRECTKEEAACDLESLFTVDYKKQTAQG
jgi:hypothetical protein